MRIVQKKNDEVRVCLDARYLNEVIESDHETPPAVEEVMRKFNDVNFFSTTDLANGYWQVELDPESRPYTAFLYNSQLYQFKRVPFGLKTAGSGFMRALSLSLKILIHFYRDTLMTWFWPHCLLMII